MKPIDLEKLPMLLSVKQAIEVSGIGRTTLYGLLASGKLPRRKIGSATRIETAVLLRFVQELPIG
jgi:excisionase family DNA binding protein